ncbi:hypothetical protein Q2E61_06830 [Microbulbifer thermotolerans]|uniref:hypothetical protein n=1 Tax=Microbulbifer thermotolerans TaxID=252514 RepID=UPI0026714C65|nr:hypothetical protein [Microbulbifer thermotolerans]WKT61905.1 hypothetical protein Q2E61_06830 [Microbulbifer thermotolerans]
MVEYMNPQESSFPGGHNPDMENAKVELHRLLTLFLASKSLSELIEDPSGERYDPILDIMEKERSEITRILLYLAILARVIDDREGRVFSSHDTDCGKLYTGADLSAINNLSLRDACNKIIHATKIRGDVDDASCPTHLNPKMYFYGTTQSGDEWKAELDIIEFAKKYATVVCSF